MKAKKVPDRDCLRFMLSLAVSKDVVNVMSSHSFRFGGEFYKQKEGGSIGSELTCVVSQCRMILWSREMRMRCLNLGLRLLLDAVYVDDTLYALKEPTIGLRLSENGLRLIVNDTAKNEDEGLSGDERAARLLCRVANEIDNDIRMTCDVPSRNDDKKIAVLDMKVGVKGDQLFFEFFEKSMTSPYVLMKNSALSWMTKKMALVGEVFRRYINTSPSLVQEGHVEQFLERFEFKMMVSGYSQRERNIVLREGKARYENILKKVEEGERPLYRPASWRRSERAFDKVIKKKKWFGEKDAVLFVQATQDGWLRDEAEKIMAEEGFNVKVVEKGGTSVKALLQKSDVHGEKRCSFGDCPICATKPTGKCCRESVGYKAWCIDCENAGESYVMHGETGRTARVRSKEHMANLRRMKNSSLWDHVKEIHGGVGVSFGWAVTGSFNEPLKRQLEEAERIDREPGNLMNSKLEWVRPAGVRTSVQPM